ncbi:MAG: hypothetical protein ACKVOQ_02515 [Cyclobacteriaceae bacterium]
MYYVRLLFLLLASTSFLFLLIGLIKPWIMLWWEDVQNRKKIIQVYGSLAFAFALIYYLLGFVEF